MTEVVAIANITSDSFAGDGLVHQSDWPEILAARAVRWSKIGIRWLDLGAESSRPGSNPIGEAEELDRICTAIEAVVNNAEIAISVDTRRSRVAEAACQAGATMVNDVSGLTYDPAIADVAARHDARLVIMHNSAVVSDVETDPRLGSRFVRNSADDAVREVVDGLRGSIERARTAGLDREQIIIDPGLGFGKSQRDNLRIVGMLNALRSEVSHPVFIGPSRKSFIGWELDLPVAERLPGTLAVTALAAWLGADYVRVHDPVEAHQVVRMVAAVSRASVEPLGGDE